LPPRKTEDGAPEKVINTHEIPWHIEKDGC
jgi:hypothetical protein